MALLHGLAGRLTAKNGGFRPGQWASPSATPPARVGEGGAATPPFGTATSTAKVNFTVHAPHWPGVARAVRGVRARHDHCGAHSAPGHGALHALEGQRGADERERGGDQRRAAAHLHLHRHPGDPAAAGRNAAAPSGAAARRGDAQPSSSAELSRQNRAAHL